MERGHLLQEEDLLTSTLSLVARRLKRGETMEQIRSEGFEAMSKEVRHRMIDTLEPLEVPPPGLAE